MDNRGWKFAEGDVHLVPSEVRWWQPERKGASVVRDGIERERDTEALWTGDLTISHVCDWNVD